MKRNVYILILCLVPIFEGYAQQELEPERFSNFSLQLTSPNVNADPGSMMPSVAKAYGFGSYIDNPASMATIENSEFMFSFFRDTDSANSSYLGTKNKTDWQNDKLGSIGVAYSVPAITGSLVIGVGYNRVISNANTYRISGRNNNSTITDSFLDADNNYFDLAFDTYAIDWGDVEQPYLESIFRIGFEPGSFPGINQEAEIRSQTYAGEYTAFLATEFRKDLFVGFSISFLQGESQHRENFLETDNQNDYDGDFIEGSDIDNILVNDRIDTKILAWKFRTGLVYKIRPGLNAGISYQFPFTIHLSERKRYFIQTSLDDNSEPFFSEIQSDGNIRYRINKPGILKAGLAYEVNQFAVSLSAEYTNYRNMKYNLLADRDDRAPFLDIWRDKQSVTNNLLKENYDDVLDIHAGTEVHITNKTTLRAGYAFLPERNVREPGNVNQLSAGISHMILSNLRFDINGQYYQKQKKRTLYEYTDFENEAQTSAFNSRVKNVRVIAALKLLF